MELAYNAVLSGEPGAKKVVKDLAGRVIKDISLVKPASHGSTLRLSIDLRVQYAAYRALKAAVQKHQAKSGSVVVLDVHTGEVLAMANQPSFNPNDRSNLRPRFYSQSLGDRYDGAGLHGKAIYYFGGIGERQVQA